MQRRKFFTILVLLTCTAIAAVSDTTAQEPAPVQTGSGHQFAAADYTGQKVFLVNAGGAVEWEYETGGACNDIWVLPNGNLLFNTGKGVTEVNRDKEIIFRYTSESEIFACQRLANGNTFIGECNSGRLLEVDPTGKIVSELRLLPEGTDGGHIYMRNARKLANGNFLVAHSGEEIVREYAPDGTVVKEFAAPGGPHSAIRLPNGNTLITCGDMHQAAMVLEVDPEGEEVWKVAHDALPGISLKFVAGVHRLPNGNTVLANWVGHNQFGQAPHLIEVTPEKKVVWTFQDHKTMKTIASVQILDVPGDPLRGEVMH
jgi:outer membrane protein assembly factor BamB